MAYKILGLGGSLRVGSATNQALQIAMQGAADNGAETKTLLLESLGLPIFSGTYEMDGYAEQEQANIQTLHEAVAEADGLILASPTYNNVLSGAVKNMIELLDVNNEDGPGKFEDKVVGLLTVQGGTSGTGNHTLTSLLLAARSLGAWATPAKVSIPASRSAFDKNGRPKDPAIEKYLKRLGREVALGGQLFAEHWGDQS